MIDYKSAGVDVTRGYRLVELIKKGAAATYDENVPAGLGSFGGFYNIPAGYKEPVLVAGTDGVGTKLRYAIVLDKHDTIGTDCVAMCVNDVVCQGAKPMFFLDYFACGRLEPEVAAVVVNGVAAACREVGCALIGGETAEMPGMYPEGEYDLAGFTVGIVEKSKVINGSSIEKGDVLVGLASSGVHSNGFFARPQTAGRGQKGAGKVRAFARLHAGRGGADSDQAVRKERARACGRIPDKGNRAHHGRRIHREHSENNPGRSWRGNRAFVLPAAADIPSAGGKERSARRKAV